MSLDVCTFAWYNYVVIYSVTVRIKPLYRVTIFCYVVSLLHELSTNICDTKSHDFYLLIISLAREVMGVTC